MMVCTRPLFAVCNKSFADILATSRGLYFKITTDPLFGYPVLASHCDDHVMITKDLKVLFSKNRWWRHPRWQPLSNVMQFLFTSIVVPTVLWSNTRDALVPVPLVSQYLMAHWNFPMDWGCVWCKSITNQFKAIIWNLIMEYLWKI